jgi:hypothetical protein
VLNAKFLISDRRADRNFAFNEHTWIIKFSSVLSNPKFAPVEAAEIANFGFEGTSADRHLNRGMEW